MVAGEHVGGLGHEVHAAEHDVGRLVVVGRELRELERVADQVGPADHFVALVVVAEDQEPFTERGLGGRDPGRELVVGREGVVVRQRNLETQHLGPPRYGVAPRRPAGGSPVASTAGVSASERGICRPDTGPAVHRP